VADRKAGIYKVFVQTPPVSTRLVAPEKAALAKIAAACCDVKRAAATGESNVHLCARA
jgi:hypothetical protein